jgi:hypothetical protein
MLTLGFCGPALAAVTLLIGAGWVILGTSRGGRPGRAVVWLKYGVWPAVIEIGIGLVSIGHSTHSDVLRLSGWVVAVCGLGLALPWLGLVLRPSRSS